MDVDPAFLYSDLVEEVYFKQPKGFETPVKEDWVFLIYKAKYELKQAGRNWHLHLKATLILLGFREIITEQCIFIFQDGSEMIIIFAYINDVIILSPYTKPSYV